jgi:hypothetical protein
MSYIERDHNRVEDNPDIVKPSSPIRLPGIAGPVMWRAEIDADNVCLTSLEIEFPNGTLDTVIFNAKTGVSISRITNNKPVELTTAMERQVLIYARIISGVHLQLAIEQAVQHVA